MPSSAVASTSSSRAGQGGRLARARQRHGLLVGGGRVEAHRAQRLGVRRAQGVDGLPVGRDLHVGVGEVVVRQPGELARRDVDPEDRRAAVLVGVQHQRRAVRRPLQRARRPVVPVAGEVAQRCRRRPSTTATRRSPGSVRASSASRATMASRLPVGAEPRAVVLALGVVEQQPPLPGRDVDQRQRRSAGRRARARAQVVTTVEPSGLTSYSSRSEGAARRRGVRSVSSIRGSVARLGVAERPGEQPRRGRDRGRGPRTAPGTLSCRIAETFFVLALLALRLLGVLARPSDGKVAERQHDRAGVARDARRRRRRRARWRRRAPRRRAAGSSHSSATSSSSSSSASGSGRRR